MKSKTFEQVQRSGILTATTSATGTDWVQLPEMACHQVALYNDTGAIIEVRYGALDGSAISGQGTLRVQNGVTQPLRGLENAKQIHVRRADTSNAQVTFSFVYEL